MTSFLILLAETLFLIKTQGVDKVLEKIIYLKFFIPKFATLFRHIDSCKFWKEKKYLVNFRGYLILVRVKQRQILGHFDV